MNQLISFYIQSFKFGLFEQLIEKSKSWIYVIGLCANLELHNELRPQAKKAVFFLCMHSHPNQKFCKKISI